MKHSYYQKYVISHVPMDKFVALLVTLKSKGFRLISAVMKDVNGENLMDVVADREVFGDESMFNYNTLEGLNGR